MLFIYLLFVIEHYTMVSWIFNKNNTTASVVFKSYRISMISYGPCNRTNFLYRIMKYFVISRFIFSNLL